LSNSHPNNVNKTIFPLLFAAVFLTAVILSCNVPLIGEGSRQPTPRPTVIVVTAEGPYLDTFDGAGDWLVGEGINGTGRVENGEYFLNIDQTQYITWVNQPRAFGDGLYELDVRLVHGPEASGFGMFFLGSSDLADFFYVLVTGDGRYDIGYCQHACQKQESLVEGYKLAPSILVDNQTNHLRVELDDGQITLLINGAPVSQVQGLQYTEGLVGLIGESTSYGGFQAAFDNLQVIEEQFIQDQQP
jgi:hypothetical protein